MLFVQTFGQVLYSQHLPPLTILSDWCFQHRSRRAKVSAFWSYPLCTLSLTFPHRAKLVPASLSTLSSRFTVWGLQICPSFTDGEVFIASCPFCWFWMISEERITPPSLKIAFFKLIFSSLYLLTFWHFLRFFPPFLGHKAFVYFSLYWRWESTLILSNV